MFLSINSNKYLIFILIILFLFRIFKFLIKLYPNLETFFLILLILYGQFWMLLLIHCINLTFIEFMVQEDTRQVFMGWPKRSLNKLILIIIPYLKVYSKVINEFPFLSLQKFFVQSPFYSILDIKLFLINHLILLFLLHLSFLMINQILDQDS